MTQAEQINGLSRAIEGMSKDLRTLTGTLNTNVARCEACRSIVQGNGTPPIDRRVTQTEGAIAGMQEERKALRRNLIVGCGVVTAMSSAIGAVVAVVCS